jgi:myo-inositol-1(or 4)-monophosphatase
LKRLEVAISAAVSAGDALMEHYGRVQKTENKESLRDVVCEIDGIAEQAVLSILQKLDADCTVLTEESGLVGNKSDAYWIVDALDGTVNYIHKIPFFCVSICYWINKKPVIGVIYNPYFGELFYSEKGKGCFINQKKLHLEDIKLNASLTAMAFSGKAYNLSKREDEFRIFGSLNDYSQGCLRTGSAAMNLGYLSNGKFSLVLGKANKLWDVAAGLLIAEESGARVNYKITDQEKKLVDYIAACPSSYHDAISEIDLSYFNV